VVAGGLAEALGLELPVGLELSVGLAQRFQRLWRVRVRVEPCLVRLVAVGAAA